MASFPGVMHGPLFYRHLEKDKCLALQQAKGNFDTHMSLSQQAKYELQWWCDNVMTAHNVISHVAPQHQITTDASFLGWGAEHDGVSTWGSWTDVEAQHHINYSRTSLIRTPKGQSKVFVLERSRRLRHF